MTGCWSRAAEFVYPITRNPCASPAQGKWGGKAPKNRRKAVDTSWPSPDNSAPCIGGVPERPKGADCKSAGSAFGGSNPPPSTKTLDFMFKNIRLGEGLRGGCRIMAITPAFQAGDVGSIPITRSSYDAG